MCFICILDLINHCLLLALKLSVILSFLSSDSCTTIEEEAMSTHSRVFGGGHRGQRHTVIYSLENQKTVVFFFNCITTTSSCTGNRGNIRLEYF